MKEYKVGYKKPPVEHQIRKGFTKNYAGRPKRSKAAAAKVATPDLLSDAVMREAGRTVTVRDGDDIKKISVLDALLRTLSTRGMKETGASRLFLQTVERARVAQTKQSDAAFAEAVETKIAQLVTLMLAEIDDQPPGETFLHPDRIILRADGQVEMLPTLEAAAERRRCIDRIYELGAKAHSLQRSINEKHRKRDVDALKAVLSELKKLQKLNLVDDMPGIEATVLRQAEQRVAATRGIIDPFRNLSGEELRDELERRGLPINLLEE